MGKYLVALAAAALFAAPAAAREPVGVAPVTALPGLISAEDYPIEALEKEEQGTVGVRLRIGTDGRVKTCTVEQSSNSPALDARTCEILIERARFTPGRDSHGRVAEGDFLQRITWRIMTAEPSPETMAAGERFILCVYGEVQRELTSAFSGEEIVNRAIASCEPDQQALSDMIQADPESGGLAELDALLSFLRKMVPERIRQERAAMNQVPVS